MQNWAKWDAEGVTWPTFEIVTPLHISWTAWGRNFEFGNQIDHEGIPKKIYKSRSKGVGKESRNLLLEVWVPLHISRMVEAGDLKISMQTDHQLHYQKVQY